MPQNRLVSTQGQDLGTGMGAGGPRGSGRAWASGSPAMAGAHDCARRRLDLVIYGATIPSATRGLPPPDPDIRPKCLGLISMEGGLVGCLRGGRLDLVILGG